MGCAIGDRFDGTNEISAGNYRARTYNVTRLVKFAPTYSAEGLQAETEARRAHITELT
jgi:hypothetical protein